MLESRWLRRIGPGLAAMGAVAVIATTTLGARDRIWDPPPCPAATGTTPGVTIGTWWRLDARLSDGRLIGQRLAVAGPAVTRPRLLDLAPESFAAGPFDGWVLVGTDDGRRSSLSLVDPVRGCARILATGEPDVIRRATLTPDRTSVIEARVDRATRADLGIFRRPLDGRSPVRRLMSPIPADVRFGPTWTTDFAWDLGGRRLAVQSCGAIACRTRVVDPATGAARLIADPTHGDLIGLADGRLVLHEACGGLPCAVIAVDVATGDARTLEGAAWQAVLAQGDDGRTRLVVETGPDGRRLRSMYLDAASAVDLPVDPDGRRLVAGPGRAGGAVETPTDGYVLGPAGRLTIGGPAVGVRRLIDPIAAPQEDLR